VAAAEQARVWDDPRAGYATLVTRTLSTKRALQLRETATPAAVSHGRGLVTDLLDAEAPGLAEEIREGIRLAVTECCANAVRHAYAQDHPGELQLTATLRNGELTVAVRDFGRGMHGVSPRAGLGLGLGIVCSTADAVELRAPGDGGAEVRMRFRVGGSR
jgi:anti-sigma regulatory factor (Ser/Thr protein kinase)